MREILQKENLREPEPFEDRVSCYETESLAFKSMDTGLVMLDWIGLTWFRLG